MKTAKAHCKCEPVAGQTTIDQFFKKIEVTLVNIAETVTENTTAIEAIKIELAEVKQSLEVKLENVKLIAEIEALRVELDHVRETSLLQIENAALKAQLEQPRSYKEPKEAKEPKIKEEIKVETPEEKKQREDAEDAENQLKEDKKTLAKEITQFEKLESYKLLDYVESNKRIPDLNPVVTDKHRKKRNLAIQEAIDEIVQLERTDTTEILKLKDRDTIFVQFVTSEVYRIYDRCNRNPILRPFAPIEHKTFMEEALAESMQDANGLVNGTYQIKSMMKKTVAEKQVKYVENHGNPSAEIVEPKHLTKAYQKERMDQAYIADAERAAYDAQMAGKGTAEYERKHPKPMSKLMQAWLAMSPAERAAEEKEKWKSTASINEPVHSEESDDEQVPRKQIKRSADEVDAESKRVRIEEPVVQFDELCLDEFEHEGIRYLRDENTHFIYDYDSKTEIGLYNEGADEIDLYESSEK